MVNTRMQDLEKQVAALEAEVVELRALLSKQVEGRKPRSSSQARESYAQVVEREDPKVDSPEPSVVELAGVDEGARKAKPVNDIGQWFEVKGWRIWRRDAKPQDEGWQVVSGMSRHWTRKTPVQGALPVSNRFGVLQELSEDSETGCKVAVIGDSRVRHLDRVFCRKTAGRKCFTRPGAKVKDLVEVVDQVTQEHQPKVVIVQVGVNNIGCSKSEELRKDYRALLATLKESRSQVIVTGILPRAGVSCGWSSRALAANQAVGEICKEGGMVFVDLWDRFYGRWDFYQRDGLHFSERGVQELSRAYERVLQGN